ncbi:MAG TPA: coproporphyrinogen-III oxidase family protein [Candidatus Polarisedimenticolia bacterium]|nr:coproporphyrinogen-III oxidase family protein [Candidatus Polarisedimenticolia bacterium]
MSERAPILVSDPAEVGSVFISNYPPYSAWTPEAVPNAIAALDAPPRPGTPLGLYLHIPFCRVRCKFCYFKVYTEKDSSQVRRYLAGLEKEVRLFSERPAIAGRPLKFVYFGGGTPSFLGTRDLKSLAQRLRSILPWDGADEITFECEPGTLTRAKLEAIRGIGVTRLSLGVESFDDGVLKENGRAHLSAEIHRAIPWIQSVRFDQLNIDLIAGMVGETWDSWRRSVSATVAIAPESVTIYQMELPYNTVYSERQLGGGDAVSVAPWTQRRDWHQFAIETLEAAGYEVSSAYTMVRKDSKCTFVYRDAVWHGCDMIGTGVASFSHISGAHFQNAAEWGAYLALLDQGRLPIDRAYLTGPADRLIRELILQLKMGRVETAYFREKFGVDILSHFGDVLEALGDQGMLRLGAGAVVLTREGLLRADALLPSFYAPEYIHARYT